MPIVIEPGVQLGRYVITDFVGRGGMASVYKAYHSGLDRHVAIKVLPDFFAQDPVARERFQQEAVAVAKLRHPNILAVYDYGEESGVPYIVSEFIEGGTLTDRMAGRALTGEEVSRLLAPVAAALDYAHAQGILHRDVKPTNIMLGAEGMPILGDFGLAKMLSGGQRLTQVGATLGTPEYMAPEQSLGQEVTVAADIYSLAVIAYEMLVGDVPFSGPTPVVLMLAHIQTPPPPPRERNPELSQNVEEALLRGLAKVPAERYPSASQLVQAIFTAASPTTTTTKGTVVAVTLRPDPNAPVSDWRQQLTELREIRQRCLLAFGGEDMGAQGDKMLGIFAGPLPAVRCCDTVRSQAHKMGIVMSAGIEMGEVVHGTGFAAGGAVEGAAAFSSLAPPGELVVSEMVQDIVSQFGPQFEELTAVPGGGRSFRLSQAG
ncbi:MAG: hypothetical protein NVSMB29_14080 [Candidatus Dormibacteria bacterium]